MSLLITEVNEEISVFTEAATDTAKKAYYLEGIYMQGNLKNRNGRIYPTSILENEMNRYNRDFVSTNRALGELGHPAGPQINADKVSHLIVSMHKEGNDFIGKARILSTPMGDIVKTFIEEGVKIGVSTRGLGSVKSTNEGIMEVQNDFHLATVDIVMDPSGPNCFVNGIMENTEYYYDIASGNWRLAEKLEETVKELKKEYTPVTIKKMDPAKAYKIFENYINSL